MACERGADALANEAAHGAGLLQLAPHGSEVRHGGRGHLASDGFKCEVHGATPCGGRSIESRGRPLPR